MYLLSGLEAQLLFRYCLFDGEAGPNPSAQCTAMLTATEIIVQEMLYWVPGVHRLLGLPYRSPHRVSCADHFGDIEVNYMYKHVVVVC